MILHFLNLKFECVDQGEVEGMLDCLDYSRSHLSLKLEFGVLEFSEFDFEFF